ncbi:MAG: zinc ribbon domain-containing protein [Deltaproteobacteria bacterium]|nr:zinc ribbon domain-containing protein [Deltaproteobacteria bacterium]
MPTYEYKCLDCGKEFSIILSISEHDKGEVKCPTCGCKNLKQLMSTFHAKTSSKT